MNDVYQEIVENVRKKEREKAELKKRFVEARVDSRSEVKRFDTAP